jgi:hypothetical protein
MLAQLFNQLSDLGKHIAFESKAVQHPTLTAVLCIVYGVFLL